MIWPRTKTRTILKPEFDLGQRPGRFSWFIRDSGVFPDFTNFPGIIRVFHIPNFGTIDNILRNTFSYCLSYKIKMNFSPFPSLKYKIDLKLTIDFSQMTRNWIYNRKKPGISVLKTEIVIFIPEKTRNFKVKNQNVRFHPGQIPGPPPAVTRRNFKISIGTRNLPGIDSG